MCGYVLVLSIKSNQIYLFLNPFHPIISLRISQSINRHELAKNLENSQLPPLQFAKPAPNNDTLNISSPLSMPMLHH